MEPFVFAFLIAATGGRRWLAVHSRQFGDTDRAIQAKALRRDAQNRPLLSQGRTLTFTACRTLSWRCTPALER